MPGQWQVKIGGKVHGPFSEKQVTHLIQSGRVTRHTSVRLSPESRWTAAEQAPGLFGNPPADSAECIDAILDEILSVPFSPSPVAEIEPPPPPNFVEAPTTPEEPAAAGEQAEELPTPAQTKRCPFCAEEILAAAIKCKHCGEMLGTAEQPPPSDAAPTNKSSGFPRLATLAVCVIAVLTVIVFAHEMWAELRLQADIRSAIKKQAEDRHFLYEMRLKAAERGDTDSVYRYDTEIHGLWRPDAEFENHFRQKRNPYSWIR